MAWELVNKNESKLERCLEIIQNSAEHYKDWDLEKLKYGIATRKGEIYYYQDNNTEISLMFIQNQTFGYWRIKHGAYIGKDPIEAIKISLSKVDDFMKEKKISYVKIFTALTENYKNGNKEYLDYMMNVDKNSSVKKGERGLEWQLNI